MVEAVDKRTGVVDNLHTLMIHVAQSSSEGTQSVVYRARSGIFHAEVAREAFGDKIGKKLDLFKPESMISEEHAIDYAGRLKEHLLEMLAKEGTDLPDRAVNIASNLAQVLSSRFKVVVTENGIQPLV